MNVKQVVAKSRLYALRELYNVAPNAYHKIDRQDKYVRDEKNINHAASLPGLEIPVAVAVLGWSLFHVR